MLERLHYTTVISYVPFIFPIVCTDYDCFPKGIYVTRITPEGPAQEAGLRMGDKILQVCSEKYPQDGAMYTLESKVGAAHQGQGSSFFC